VTAPRIHGELLKLGIKISERTVSRILRTVPRPPSQTWKTFLRNHVGEIIASDFFTVPTVRTRVLFVFIVLAHHRRKVLHFGITEHPTSEWAGRQVVEAFAEREPQRYLIRDRDARYGIEFRSRLQSLRMKEMITAPPSPLAERLCGTADWFDSTCVSGPCRGFQCETPAWVTEELSEVLSRFTHAFGFREGRSEAGDDSCYLSGRWAAPPL
jgi:hypothetical protein